MIVDNEILKCVWLREAQKSYRIIQSRDKRIIFIKCLNNIRNYSRIYYECFFKFSYQNLEDNVL